jgi:(p)ppGpp synthase/HD superfamily hydrolase
MARGYSQSRSELTAQDYDDMDAKRQFRDNPPTPREKARAESNQRAEVVAQHLKTAYTIAEKIHATQTRRDGAPYMQHVMEVADGVRNPKARMVALLHDTMEDGNVSRELLEASKIPEDVIAAVEALTRPPKSEQKMTYQEYIEQVVKPNELARQVKIADLKSNLKNNDNPGQVKRYERALKALLP